MVNDTSIYSLKLSSLPFQIRQLLSQSLNSEKVILCDGPDKLPRDWRGLAFQVNLSSRLETYIKQQYEDKTAKVLELWQQTNNSATVGELLEYLECIDRYDVAEDVYNDLRKAVSSGELSRNSQNQIAIPSTGLSTEPDSGVITYDDRPGYAQLYDAMVLYAAEDKDFVEIMMERMTVKGYQLCTVDDLQVGHTTQYAPVSRLISERCRRVILVLSPDFLDSPGMKFYMNYATADGIETEQRKILPLMYRNCQLPRHLSFYHKLFYESNKPPLYDFWKKLQQSLEVARMSTAQPQYRMNNRIQQPSPPQITIDEYPSGKILSDYMDSNLFLPRPDLSISLPGLNSLNTTNLCTTQDCHSLSNVSQVSGDSHPKKKKKSYFRKFFSTFKGKKSKEAIMVAD
ncbi:unnamed protein product [Arctia plantaginis]|uniref:Myeloid differentiation primary response protein MyD88 n=1 Tax=Arctia plantaginis TaxID=874455 RepID=A0A8S0ZN70_ARCPL|nr:unnamed protein product [Arctia plantaginis]